MAAREAHDDDERAGRQQAEGPAQAGLIDTHCHLGHGDLSATELRASATAAGISWLVDVGIDAATSQAASERALSLPQVVSTAGLHPCDADRLESDFESIARLAREPHCVAVGESGFDFYWDKATPAQQKTSFERHLELARELGKPVVVHCRDAFDATFDLLAAWPGVPFVMHCFAGGVDEARRTLELGGMISLAGPLTYPKAEALREAARFAPLESLLVETDAPFLPPQGYRGKQNQPAWVVHTHERLAAERGLPIDACAAATTANALRTFSLAD